MDDDGGRPPALDCLRAAAHRRFDVALACRRRRAPLVAGLHGGLSDHLPVRSPHRGATSAQGPSVGARDRRADRERAAARADPRPAPARRQDAMTALSFVPVWTLILGAGIFFDVLLDGFDLGVGMLYDFMPDTRSRKLVMNAIAPVWDGNETWLVLGGVALLAAFPLAFAIIIPAVYFPILVMLLGLVFRGVAFEFRFRHPTLRRFWGGAFHVGSVAATLAQGIVLGTFIHGFEVRGREYVGTSFDWATPFAFLTGIALLFGYTLLGASWLVLKTEGELQQWARRAGRISLIGVVIGIAAVSIWTPLADPDIARRWFSWPNIAFLSPVPIITGAIVLAEWYVLTRDYELAPFLGGIGLFLMSYIGIAISLWPMIVPHHYTLWQAASSESTQAFLLIGTLFLLPIILMYTAWSYWVFRGKVRGDIGYH